MFRINLQLFAHKKGVGSSRNGRESESKRLGSKRADGQFVLAGNILVRQRGTHFHPWPITSASVRTILLFAKVDGILRFEIQARGRQVRQRLSRGNRRLSFSPSEFLTAPQIRAECKQNNIKQKAAV